MSFIVYYIKGFYWVLYFSMIGYDGMIVLVFCMVQYESIG